MNYSALLDTSFFIRLLNDEDQLHENAVDYYKYFLENDIDLKISTISIAEYCVRGKLSELPLQNLQILPFNILEAQRTGEIAKVIFTKNKSAEEKLYPRSIIPNDSKLFAQADIHPRILYFVTSDERSGKTINLMSDEIQPKFSFVDISKPVSEQFKDKQPGLFEK